MLNIEAGLGFPNVMSLIMFIGPACSNRIIGECRDLHFEFENSLRASDCRYIILQCVRLKHSTRKQIKPCERWSEVSEEDTLFPSAAKVLEPAEKLCSESVKPYLGFVLEELMEPISSGFQEGRQLSETLMDNVCQGAQQGDNEKVKKVWSS